VPQFASNEIQYKAVRVNVQLLTPIQMGFAVANGNGQVLGVWNFNLRFDATKDLHLESALKFLTSAGLDFRRHAREGIDCEKLGQRMGASLRALCGWSGEDASDSVGPCWVTFSGLHDLGYLLKLLTSGRSPPSSMASFEEALHAFCPHRCELKELLPPYGSLESWVQKLKVPRVGRAHTAGSDAVATLMVFLVVGQGARQKVPGEVLAGPRWAERPASTGTEPLGQDQAGKLEQLFAHALGAALTSQTGAHATSLLIKCA
jgi:CCR4-NOT transcription complex subunit 7/8